jgi:hypothetical protein
MEDSMDYTMLTTEGVHFNIVGEDANGNPADLMGATPTINNNNPAIVTATIDNGLLKIVPVTAGIAVVNIIENVAGVFITGTLNITVNAPLPPATQIVFTFADNFPLS